MAEVRIHDVRAGYCYIERLETRGSVPMEQLEADFDAWHRKELAKAWEEGYLHATGHKPEQDCWATNPYKKEA